MVEDNAATRELLGRSLEEAGHSVVVAGDLATASPLALEGAFDLAILDVMLPDGSGLCGARPGAPAADFRGAGETAPQGGFGLGLPILRRVARAHGGDVEVSRSDLGGARFVLILPRLQRSVAG